MERNADFAQRKIELNQVYQAYLLQHPELKQMLHDFVSSVLAIQPDNLKQYAKTYFQKMTTPQASTSPTTADGGEVDLTELDNSSSGDTSTGGESNAVRQAAVEAVAAAMES
jgi:hypothetical protein